MADALIDQIALLEDHITQSEGHIQRQREIIADVERTGLDATTAQDLMRVYEQLLSDQLAELERLRHEFTTGVAHSVP